MKLRNLFFKNVLVLFSSEKGKLSNFRFHSNVYFDRKRA